MAKRSPEVMQASFTGRLLRYSNVDLVTGCWIWSGVRLPSGYGVISRGVGRRMYAHRAMYEYFKGPIPSGHEIDHRCRNKSCVNPEHLEAVIRRVNTQRYWAQRWTEETHCAAGHAYAEHGRVWFDRKRGRQQRICRICQCVWHREYRARWRSWKKERLSLIGQRSN